MILGCILLHAVHHWIADILSGDIPWPVHGSWTCQSIWGSAASVERIRICKCFRCFSFNSNINTFSTFPGHGKCWPPPFFLLHCGSELGTLVPCGFFARSLGMGFLSTQIQHSQVLSNHWPESQWILADHLLSWGVLDWQCVGGRWKILEQLCKFIQGGLKIWRRNSWCESTKEGRLCNKYKEGFIRNRHFVLRLCRYISIKKWRERNHTLRIG